MRKQIILALILFTLCIPLLVDTGYADPPTGKPAGSLPNTKLSGQQEYLGGEHAPLVFTGLDTLLGDATTSVTHWMQIGWTENIGANSPAGRKSNAVAMRHNPEVFTLIFNCDTLNLTTADNQDSIGGLSIRFETAYDTTDDQIWNIDRSNLVLNAGNSDSTLGGIWVFENLLAKDVTTTNDTLSWAAPLRVLSGAFIRLIFSQGTIPIDTQAVDWTLICEN